MTRQLLSYRKVRGLARRTGLPIVAAMVRGGTDHRIDLCLDDGTIAYLSRDGSVERSDERWSNSILERGRSSSDQEIG